MTTILLIRHAVNDYVKTGKLAGWTPGVHLNEDGVAQAKLLGERLAAVPLQAIYSSPLERAVETAEAVREHHAHLPLNVLEGVGEVQFGEWQGMSLNELRRRKLWDVVQRTPSRATFSGRRVVPRGAVPGRARHRRVGEGTPGAGGRGVQPLRRHQADRRPLSRHAPRQFPAYRDFDGVD